MKRGLHRVPGADAEVYRERLEANGWRVLVLPPGIASTESFFQAVRDHLPLDPELPGERTVWDALSDSLSGGLDLAMHDKIAIIWPDSNAMAESAPSDFSIAKSILEDLAGPLADPELTETGPTELVVLLT